MKNSLGWVGGLTSHNGEIWDEGMTRGDTVDGSGNPANQLIGSSPHHSQGFIHPRVVSRISEHINSIMGAGFLPSTV